VILWRRGWHIFSRFVPGASPGCLATWGAAVAHVAEHPSQIRYFGGLAHRRTPVVRAACKVSSYRSGRSRNTPPSS
jgi:hypothetical protein